MCCLKALKRARLRLTPCQCKTFTLATYVSNGADGLEAEVTVHQFPLEIAKLPQNLFIQNCQWGLGEQIQLIAA